MSLLFLLLLWNPLVLRPRFWSETVVVKWLTIDAALLLIGVGLILVKRWAALLDSLVTVCLAIGSTASGSGSGSPLILGLLMLLPLTPVFWRDLVRGDRRDFLPALASLVASALFQGVAFVMHQAWKPEVELGARTR